MCQLLRSTCWAAIVFLILALFLCSSFEQNVQFRHEKLSEDASTFLSCPAVAPLCVSRDMTQVVSLATTGCVVSTRRILKLASFWIKVFCC